MVVVAEVEEVEELEGQLEDGNDYNQIFKFIIKYKIKKKFYRIEYCKF